MFSIITAVVILHVAPNWESESLGVSWSSEVGLQVQKCAVVLLIICASRSQFLLCLKDMLGLIYCSLGFMAWMAVGKGRNWHIYLGCKSFFFFFLP